MAGLFEEFKRRNVVRVGIAYVVVAWLILQFADLVLENIDAPTWVMQAFMLLLVIGLPLALFFAWAYELTPEGLKTTKEVDRSDSVTHSTGRKLDRIIIAVLVVALGYFVWESQIRGDAAEDSVAAVAESVEPADVMAGGDAENDADEVRRSIAVLPFVNMSSDEEQEWFADGLTEEILNSLARTPDLLVSSRTSSFVYKGSNEELPNIAAALGVEHILEGSVRKAGDRLRVTAQLIRAKDGFHLWSQTYDRQVADLIDIQEDVAIAIAQALKTAIDPEALARFVSSGTDSIPAYEAYLKGIAAISRSFETGDIYELLAAKEALEEAIVLDPEFSLAYWQLATFWQVQLNVTLTHAGVTDLPLQEILVLFEEAQEKATEFETDPVRKLFYRANSATQRAEPKQGLRLNTEYLRQRPNDLDAQSLQLNLLSELRRDDIFIETARKFNDADIHDPSLMSSSILGLLYAGDMDELRAMTQVAYERFPEYNGMIYQIHRALLWTGDIDGASNLLPFLESSDLPADVRLLSSLRQACAERQISKAEKLYERSKTVIAPDDAVTIWLTNKIMGYDAVASAYLKEIDQRQEILRLSSFLNYGTFDRREFPNLMKHLEGQIDEPREPDVIPYRCHKGGASG